MGWPVVLYATRTESAMKELDVSVDALIITHAGEKRVKLDAPRILLVEATRPDPHRLTSPSGLCFLSAGERTGTSRRSLLHVDPRPNPRSHRYAEAATLRPRLMMFRSRSSVISLLDRFLTPRSRSSCGMQQVEGYGVDLPARSLCLPRIREHQAPHSHLHR